MSHIAVSKCGESAARCGRGRTGLRLSDETRPRTAQGSWHQRKDIGPNVYRSDADRIEIALKVERTADRTPGRTWSAVPSRMVICQLASESVECPLPAAEDRLSESFHVARRFDAEYHDPRAFRFNLNSLVTALSSVREILQKEIERTGRIADWNRVSGSFKQDRWLNAIKRARNTTLHQRAIFDGSQVEIGLYRGRRHKLSIGAKVPGDTHSRVLLEKWVNSDAGKLFLDPEHTAIGEQYGVWRRYHIKELSETEDVLTASRRGLIRAHDMLVAAHRLYEIEAGQLPDDLFISPERLALVSVLLESDVDPQLPIKWRWVEPE